MGRRGNAVQSPTTTTHSTGPGSGAARRKRKPVVRKLDRWGVQVPTLCGPLVTVRPLKKTDAALLDTILRDTRVTRFLPFRVRHESGVQFVARVLQEQRRGDGVAFVILKTGSEELVGQMRLMNWSRLERQAEIGYFLRRRWWGHGFASEAAKLVCRFGFRSMDLYRIRASVVAGNDASDRVLAKAGFRWEGTARGAARLASGWRDTHEYGLLEPDFPGT